jgi:hypothetical protein
MPRSTQLPELSPRVQRCHAARSGRRVQSRVLVFKDGHPYLVRLPSPMSNRLCNGEPTVFTPSCSLRRALAPPKRSSTEPLTRRHGRRAALCQVPLTSRQEPSRPQCGETERRPDSSAPSTGSRASTAFVRALARLGPRIRIPACAILTTHGHARRSSRPPTA